MAWSSGYSGHPLLRQLSQTTPLPVLSAGGQRLTSSIARGVSLTFGLGTCSRRVTPQVAVHKGDMPTGVTESTLLLTNREKPIIINSFHRGRGARICGLSSFFAGESPGRFLESKKIEAYKEEVLIPNIRGYIFHG